MNSLAVVLLFACLLLLSADVSSRKLQSGEIRANSKSTKLKTSKVMPSTVAHARKQQIRTVAVASVTSSKLFQEVMKQYVPTLLLVGLIGYKNPALVEDFNNCVGKLAIGGLICSFFQIGLAIPQAHNLSNGALPPQQTAKTLFILMKSLPIQTGFKVIQFYSLRILKKSLDNLPWMPSKTANTLLSFGITATIMQCVAYNHAIGSTYSFYKVGRGTKGTGADTVKYAPLALLDFINGNVVPGIVFSFLRECFATGLGIILSPIIRSALQPYMESWSPVSAKIASGTIAGSGTALLTQWLHNNALTASSTYQYSGALPSPAENLKLTWNNIGKEMFYKNFEKRILTIISATIVLSIINIFE